MRIQDRGFQYTGKDRRGVSRWHGNWDGVLRWLGLIFICYGSVAGIGGIGMLLYALFTLSWPSAFNALVALALTHAATFGGIGAWSLKMRKHIQSLATSEELSNRLGMDTSELAQAAQLNGIKPRMSINEVDYFNPNDFAEAMTLLRGATEPPVTSDVLLRPAAGSSPDVPADQLLRADMPAQADYIPTDRYTTDQTIQAVQAGQE